MSGFLACCLALMPLPLGVFALGAVRVSVGCCDVDFLAQQCVSGCSAAPGCVPSGRSPPSADWPTPHTLPPHIPHSTENEKNRRRDLVGALRRQREQMLASLKREQPRAAREALLGGASSSGGGGTGGGRETDITAELGSQGLLQLQQSVMQQQDQHLESLEHTVVSTKHIALQVRRVGGGGGGWGVEVGLKLSGIHRGGCGWMQCRRWMGSDGAAAAVSRLTSAVSHPVPAHLRPCNQPHLHILL